MRQSERETLCNSDNNRLSLPSLFLCCAHSLSQSQVAAGSRTHLPSSASSPEAADVCVCVWGCLVWSSNLCIYEILRIPLLCGWRAFINPTRWRMFNIRILRRASLISKGKQPPLAWDWMRFSQTWVLSNTRGVCAYSGKTYSGKTYSAWHYLRRPTTIWDCAGTRSPQMHFSNWCNNIHY